MSYNENLKNRLGECEALIQKYEDGLSSERYVNAVANAPFEFISAINVCEMLDAYNDKENGTKMRYESADDAAMIYNKIVGFKQKKDIVLDNADAIVEVGKIADEINEMVSSDAYLPDSLKVAKDDVVFDFAERVISMASEYTKNLSKEFRDNFTESCLKSLPKSELDKLVSSKVIREIHLDNIPVTGSKAYEDNYRHLCVDIFNKTEVSIGKYEQKLVGVTFENPDGVKRQDLLKEIQTKIKNNEPVVVTATLGKYKPELGPEEPSVEIKWDNKTIGFLNKESARQIEEKSNKPIVLEASVKEVTGGDKAIYGCNILVDVKAMVKEKENDEKTLE